MGVYRTWSLGFEVLNMELRVTNTVSVEWGLGDQAWGSRFRDPRDILIHLDHTTINAVPVQECIRNAWINSHICRRSGEDHDTYCTGVQGRAREGAQVPV